MKKQDKNKPRKEQKKNKTPRTIEEQIGFLVDSVGTLIDDQAIFKDEVAKQIKDIRSELGKTNPQAENEFVPLPAPETNYTTPTATQGEEVGQDYIKDGVNFGKGSPTQRADQGRGNVRPTATGGQFQGWGQTIAGILSQPEVGANLIVAIKEMIKPKAQFDTMFNQFVMRDFLENYAQSKVMNKAMIGMMVKKGFLQETDAAPFMKQQETLFDPIKQTIEKMQAASSGG